MQTLFDKVTTYFDGEAYHAQHPDVWKQFEALALEMARRGETRWSAKGIFEVIRRQCRVNVNNNMTAWYARHFLDLHPELPGFFRLRTSQMEASHV